MVIHLHPFLLLTTFLIFPNSHTCHHHSLFTFSYPLRPNPLSLTNSFIFYFLLVHLSKPHTHFPNTHHTHFPHLCMAMHGHSNPCKCFNPSLPSHCKTHQMVQDMEVLPCAQWEPCVSLLWSLGMTPLKVWVVLAALIVSCPYSYAQSDLQGDVSHALKNSSNASSKQPMDGNPKSS